MRQGTAWLARLGGLGLFRRGNMCLVKAVMEGQRLFRTVTVGRGKAVVVRNGATSFGAVWLGGLN